MERSINTQCTYTQPSAGFFYTITRRWGLSDEPPTGMAETPAVRLALADLGGEVERRPDHRHGVHGLGEPLRDAEVAHFDAPLGPAAFPLAFFFGVSFFFSVSIFIHQFLSI